MQDGVDHEEPELAPYEPLHRFVELPDLIGAAAGEDRLGYAMLGMVGEKLEGNTLECSPRRVDLREDVDAVSILFDHLLDSAHLALYSPKPSLNFLLVLRVPWHDENIPPLGIAPAAVDQEWVSGSERNRNQRTRNILVRCHHDLCYNRVRSWTEVSPSGSAVAGHRMAVAFLALRFATTP